MLRVETDAVTTNDAEQEVDAAIQEFSTWFKNLQTDENARLDLSGPEYALIKTFCGYFLGIGPNNPHAPPHKRTKDGDSSSC